MKKLLLLSILISKIFATSANAQTVDTLINVSGGHKLHFKIIKGKSAPILFESGFGNGGEVWDNITKPIADATGATIITYDRLSNVVSKQQYELGIEKETIALEEALQKLGYSNKKIMLVAHSLGGIYCSYYSSHHQNDVKAAVFIDDATICSLTSHFDIVKLTKTDTIENYLYSLLNNVEKRPMPESIPLIDIVADTHFDDNGSPDTVWLSCHKKFVAQSINRKLLLAYNVGHYVFVENAPLVINTIISQYGSYLEPKEKLSIYENGLQISSQMFNEIKKNEVKCGQAENDLLTWGYSLLEKNEAEKAIEIFKLNVLLNPNGWNNYDSLGEAYYKAGNKTLAIKNYKKSLELNPKNDNATKFLQANK
jgi:tetratricopeptide (TPR) repeat protein